MGQAKFIDRLMSSGELQDKADIEYLWDLPVTSKESYLWNYHVIDRHFGLSLDSVAVELFARDIQIEIQEFKEFLETTRSNLYDNNQFISDDDEKIASSVIQGMLRITDKHSHSVLGLIQSCRLFVPWMSESRLEAPDESTLELMRAIDIAVFEKTIDFIISIIGHSLLYDTVEYSLKKIRSLYRVMPIVATKSALEGNNRISRRIQKIFGLYPKRSSSLLELVAQSPLTGPDNISTLRSCIATISSITSWASSTVAPADSIAKCAACPAIIA